MSEPTSDGWRENRGYELLPKILASKQDAVRQALDQGCWLERSGSGGGHSYRLIFPEGMGSPIPIAAKSDRVGGDPNIQMAFRADLRRKGLVIDGITMEIDEKGSGRMVRREPPAPPKPPESPPMDLEARLRRPIVEADDVLAAVTQVSRLRHRETTASEVRGILQSEETIGPEVGLDAVHGILAELFAHNRLMRRQVPSTGAWLYALPGFVPYRSAGAPPLRDEEERPAPAAPALGIAVPPPGPAPRREPGLLTPAAWQALHRAALALAEFTALMAEEETTHGETET